MGRTKTVLNRLFWMAYLFWVLFWLALWLADPKEQSENTPLALGLVVLPLPFYVAARFVFR